MKIFESYQTKLVQNINYNSTDLFLLTARHIIMRYFCYKKSNKLIFITFLYKSLQEFLEDSRKGLKY